MTSTPIHDELAVPGGAPDASVTLPAASLAPAEIEVAEDAEHVVGLAWREAADHGHGQFGSGHLLVGLVAAGGPEAELLAAAGVTARTAGAALALVARHSASEPVAAGVGCPPEPGLAVAEVLGEACWAAAAAGRPVIGAAEVLLALLARPWGQAAEMLAALAVPTDGLAEAVRALAPASPDPMTATLPRPLAWRDPSRLLTRAHRPAPGVEAEAELEDEVDVVAEVAEAV